MLVIRLVGQGKFIDREWQVFSRGSDNVFGGVLMDVIEICELCNSIFGEIYNCLNIIFRKELMNGSLFERRKSLLVG